MICKYLLYTAIILATLISCRKSADINTLSQTSDLTEETDTIDIDTIPEIELDTIIHPKVYNEGIDIFLTGLYREYEVDELKSKMRDEWYSLCMDTINHNFRLGKVLLKIAPNHDDCLGIGVFSTYLSVENPLEATI